MSLLIGQLVEEASRHNYWVRVKQTANKLEEKTEPPPVVLGDDKLLQLKRIVLVVVHDLETIFQALKQVLDSSSLPQEIIQLVKVVKEVKQQLSQGMANS